MVGELVLPFQPLNADRRYEAPDSATNLNRKVKIMKAIVGSFLKSKITRAGVLLGLVAVVAASLAWSDPPEPGIKLGGTWVGRYGDITWTGAYSPDPSGQHTVFTLQWMTMNAQYEYLLDSLGASTLSLSSGRQYMTGPETAISEQIFYALAPGIASTTQPVAGKVKAIFVMVSEWNFTSPGTAAGTSILRAYLPDASGSLVPAEGAVPFLSVTNLGVTHVKVF